MTCGRYHFDIPPWHTVKGVKREQTVEDQAAAQDFKDPSNGAGLVNHYSLPGAGGDNRSFRRNGEVVRVSAFDCYTMAGGANARGAVCARAG